MDRRVEREGKGWMGEEERGAKRGWREGWREKGRGGWVKRRGGVKRGWREKWREKGRGGWVKKGGVFHVSLVDSLDQGVDAGVPAGSHNTKIHFEEAHSREEHWYTGHAHLNVPRWE